MSLIERCADGYCASQPACPRGRCERAEKHERKMAERPEVERLREQLAEVVSREHAVQAIGWLSAEIAVHGAPSLGPEWLELWDRALTATGGQ